MIWLAVCRPLRIPRSSQQLRKEKVSSPSENTATNTRAPCLRAHHPRERKSTATLGTECQTFRAQIVKSPGISTRHLLQLAFPVLALAHLHTKPQESHAQKRQRKQQQLPSPITRRSHFHVRRSFAITRRTFHNHPRMPQFLLITLCLGPIYDLPTQVFQFHRVHHFRQTTRHRPHANFNFQIRRNRASWRRLHDHIEEAGTYVRMSPERNHHRSHALIRNNWKWRPIVRAQRGTRDPQDHDQRPELAPDRSTRIVKTYHRYVCGLESSVASLSRQECPAHIHRLEHHPYRRNPQDQSHRGPWRECTQRTLGTIAFRQFVNHQQRTRQPQHQKSNLQQLHEPHRNSQPSPSRRTKHSPAQSRRSALRNRHHGV